MNNRILGLLGLCTKAGKIQSGQFLCMKAMEGGKARLLIMATDITYRTRKTLVDQAKYRGVPVFEAGLDQEDLGHAIGQSPRCAVCVTDEHFASLLQPELSENHSSNQN